MEGNKSKEVECADSRDFSFRINNLDMDNPEHVVWAYKNIQRVYSHSAPDFNKMIRMMMEHRPLDFNTGLVVLEEVANILQSCFVEEKKDEEISFVASRCGLAIGDRTDAPEMQCVDYLYRLVIPFARTCTKQVVDIVAFLFTRTTVAEFDELFEIFGKKKDFLVELYLLKVKLMRERSSNYRCRRCRNVNEMNCLSMEECIKNMKISLVGKSKEEADQEKKTDFYSIDDATQNRKEKCSGAEEAAEDLALSQDRPFFEPNAESDSSASTKCSDTSDEKNKLNGSSPNHKFHQVSNEPSCPNLICMCGTTGQVGTTCLCASYETSDEIHCLGEAKKHLMDIESISPRFFLENVALYLSLSFDEELLNLFRKYTNTEYQAVCASHVFKLRTVDSGTIEAMVEEMRNAKREMLKSDFLPITSTTFGLYIGWCMDTFGSISISSVSDYSDISRLYIRFLRAFRHKKMFLILAEICGCRIERVSAVACAYIADNLEEIVEIFLNLFDNTEADPRLSKDEEKVLNTLLNDEKIFKDVCRLDAPGFCIKQELEKIVLEVCRRHRKAFLPQIKILHRFLDSEFRLKVIGILCTDYANDWRYRRALLHSYRENPCFFKGVLNLTSFTKDPVFIVRRTALDIKEELGSEIIEGA
ncbi:hypothetical protein M970_101600 [Encephalitozoon cuniculi EcunIII-L]|uniref:Uncharacterized protein n=1 Tax=Encephalitozoon cuniculi TaxID=6035 RepID=M1K9Y2_ENCCN|nr:hypothetical protein ECU10_1650 [Encephalitozoon cuniculi]KMV65319.1 hypothetical protein M970_101600 [Encephalitozoon cuniculi EcunIII-L]UYI26631.1 hypothetical protein J0A71_02g04620 [Encephalitozoon cuniculi]